MESSDIMQWFENMKMKFKDIILPSFIGYGSEVEQAYLQGKTVVTEFPTSTVSQQFEYLTKSLGMI
jgi:MinD-like ATPase involved in chromosome partitioning or flagellar assembly